jgi:hypothetical protein
MSRFVFCRAVLRVAVAAGVIAGITAASASAQTVEVGAQSVNVPTSGVISIDGQPVSVPAGFSGRMVLVTAPPGSTPVQESGQTDDQLPSGATGSSFSLLPQTTTAASVSSTAVYAAGQPAGTTAQASTDAAFDQCDLYADPPEPYTGRSTVYADSYTYCNTGHVLDVGVISTLYWLGNDGWEWQSNDSADGGADQVVLARATHSCTAGTTHAWHTRNDTSVTDYTTDISYAGYVNSGNNSFKCP